MARDDLRRIAPRLRLLTLDCDGVMTDGALFYADDGRQWRTFDVRDGVGINKLRAAGIAVAFLTSSDTSAIVHRAATLGIEHCLVGVKNKLAAIEALCTKLGIGLDAVAHVGDDLNDLPVLRGVGLPVTVSDAAPEVLAAAAMITARPGGRGAIRELAERLLDARGAVA